MRSLPSFEAMLCLAAASTLPLTLHLASHIHVRGSSTRHASWSTGTTAGRSSPARAEGLLDVPRLSAELESVFASEWGGTELSHLVLEEGLLPLAPPQHLNLARLRRALAARIATCAASARSRSASPSACTLRLVFVGSALTAGRVSEEVVEGRARMDGGLDRPAPGKPCQFGLTESSLVNLTPGDLPARTICTTVRTRPWSSESSTR